MTTVLTIEKAGPLLLLQDKGRFRYGHQGVSQSGFADRVSAKLANRLLGNDEGACLFESLLGGVLLRLSGRTTLAVVTGIEADIRVHSAVRVSGQAPGIVFSLLDGDVLEVGRARHGLRAYLAFRGRISAPTVLGSCSRDTLAHLGPEPCMSGDRLELRQAWARTEPVAYSDLGVIAAVPVRQDVTRLHVLWGPRNDWLTEAGVKAFTQQTWRVSIRSDRVGARLIGDSALDLRTGSLPSEGTRPGAIEVPPDGFPLVLLADTPVTVGYPVVGVLADERCISLMAQSAPGQAIRFLPVTSPEAAQRAHRGPGLGIAI